ncbi:MAG: MBL fold metallo-hydrolase [Deltaproteobacteria bacterium]|nr:MBL fold metallo-hydrolase [Deltaproteobacteria bacterium]
MLLDTFPVPPLGCNCSILADPASLQAVIIDPGGAEEKIVQKVTSKGLKVVAILHTHTHFDHVGATAAVQAATGAPARIHEADLFLYDMLPVQVQLLGLRRAPPRAELDAFLKDGEVVPLGALSLAVLHTPGSVCFQLLGADRPVVFTGDTLFAGSVGRTDLWGGDSDALLKSIRGRLLGLADETLVVAGHEAASTIGRERRGNPFLVS